MTATTGNSSLRVGPTLGLALLLAFSGMPRARGEVRRADVVVYGGTASGVIAAVAAAREGKSVLLVEPGTHVGGMVSGGLGATDTGRREAIGGTAREFFERVKARYVKTYGVDSAQVKDCSDGFRFEPRVAEAIFREMLAEAKVTVVFDRPIVSVTKTGTRLTALRSAAEIITGGVFIDASYEGDLMARAGVKSVVGREGRTQYGESLAGVQLRSAAHQWPMPVSPFAADGKTLLPFVQPGPAGLPGSADRKTQAYNYRLCMTERPDNRVPFPRPPDYDPKRYAVLARYLEKRPDVKVGQLMNPVRVPNGKTDTNNNGPFSTDHIGGNWDYPEADPARREQIRLDHIAYVQGFLYFLANDPAVPRALHDEMNGWGLAKDEFTDTGNWPHQLYVRESRRMIGVYVMTQADIMNDRDKPDSVGLGSYNTDSHHVQRVPTADGAAINEGDFQVGVQPYAIPYQSLIPRATECENLLVPVCLSASHVAYGTIRMEPVYMILGHASGVAAALAIDGKVPVQLVPVAPLQEKLKARKSVLDPTSIPPTPTGSAAGAPARALDPKTLEGIVVDDEAAAKTGDWSSSTSIGPYVGSGYLHDADADKGAKRVRFTPELPKAGRYEVRLHSTPSSNRSKKVPVIVHFDGGETTVVVDQQAPLADGKPIRLGTFPFAAGTAGWVEVRNDGTTGHVIADAVQFVPGD